MLRELALAERDARIERRIHDYRGARVSGFKV